MLQNFFDQVYRNSSKWAKLSEPLFRFLRFPIETFLTLAYFKVLSSCLGSVLVLMLMIAMVLMNEKKFVNFEVHDEKNEHPLGSFFMNFVGHLLRQLYFF